MQKVHPNERTYLKEYALSCIPINHFACSCKVIVLKANKDYLW